MAYRSTKHVAFGGTNERVDMGDVLDFDYNEPFSISFWCRFTSTSAMAVVSKMGGATAYQGYMVYVQQHVRFQLSNDYAALANLLDVNISETISDGNWHHVCVTYDGSADVTGCAIYIDGSSKSLTTNSNSLSATTITANAFQLGDRTASSLPYTGDLDEISVYNAELSSGDVTALYNSGTPTDLAALSSATNLVAWWKMGDGDTFPTLQDSGLVGADITLAEDLSGNGYDGTPTNMTSGDISSDTSGGRAFSFNGTDEYITMGDVLGFEYDEPFSVSCWFKTSVSSGGKWLVAKIQWSPDYRGWGASFNGATGALGFVLSNATGVRVTKVTDTTGYNDGLWHHLVVTYSASTPGAAADVVFYVDGAVVSATASEDTLGSNTIASTASLNVGWRSDGDGAAGQSWDGEIDEVAVYGKELSAAEVDAIYNYGAPTDLRLLEPSSASLLSYWSGENDTPNEVVDKALHGGVVEVTGNEDIPDESPGVHNPGSTVNMDQTNVQRDVPRSDFCRYSTTLNGSDAFWQLGNVLAFEYTDPFSISLWFRGQQYSTDSLGYLLAKMTQGSQWRGYALFTWSTGQIAFEISSDAGSSLEMQINTDGSGWQQDEKWHHLVATYSAATGTASDMAIYIDGVAQSTTTAIDSLGTNTIVSTVGLNIGGYADGLATPKYLYTGNICDVSIYNDDLTAGEVTELYNDGKPLDARAAASAVDLVGYWRCGTEDRADLKSRDLVLPSASTFPSIPNASRFVDGAGTLTNMTAGDVQGDVPGGTYTAYSASFNADDTDERMVAPHSSLYNFDEESRFSLSVWIKTSDTSGFVMGKIDATSGWGIDLDASGKPRFYFFNSTGSVYMRVRGDTALNNGAWHHLVVTTSYNGTNDNDVTVYLDGSSISTVLEQNDLGAASALTTAAFTLADKSTATEPLVCLLDEAAVYNDVLTAADVTAIYNSGVPLDLGSLYSHRWLVAWWRMGDDVGNDATPNGTIGVTNRLGDVPGEEFSYRSLTFAGGAGGSDEYVQVSNVGDVFDLDYTDAFSLAGWVKQSGGNNECLISRCGSTEQGWSLWIDYTGNDITLILKGASDQIHIRAANPSILEGNKTAWQHICCTYSGSGTPAGVKLYLDGRELPVVVVDSGPVTSTIIVDAPVLIGRGAEEADNFAGNLDSVAVYDRVLTAGEVTELYNSGAPGNLLVLASYTSLIGYWRMGDTGYLGTMVNMDFTNLVDGVQGGYSRASFDLNGTDQYVTMGDVLDFERTDPFSFAFWIKTTDTSGFYAVAKRESPGDGGQGWGCLQASGKLYFLMIEDLGGYLQITTPDDTIDGKWHHICATYDGSSAGSGVNLFIDGKLRPKTIEGDSLTTGTTVTAEAFLIGARAAGTSYWLQGLIDEVVVYDKELSVREVAELYGIGAPVDPRLLTSSEGNLAGYWRLGEVSFDGTMTNMESTDIVEGSGPGWEWGTVFRGTSQLLRSPIFRPQQDAQQEKGIFPELQEGIHVGGLWQDFTSLRSPLGLTRDPQTTGAPIPPGGVTIVHYFRMRGYDNGAPGYTTWTAQDAPDPNGAQATPANTTPTLVGPIQTGSGITLHTWEQES